MTTKPFDAELELLQKVISPLIQKIEELKKNPKHNENVLKVANNLKTELDNAITTYIRSMSNSGLNEKELVRINKTVFMDSCTKAINSAKPLLEKELGWGTFLTNILKSLVNAAIGAVNTVSNVLGSQSQITFFTLVKAPLIPDIEQIEQSLSGKLGK